MSLLLGQLNLALVWLVALPTLGSEDWRWGFIVVCMMLAAGLVFVAALLLKDAVALVLLRFDATFQRQARRIAELEWRLRGSDSADAREAARFGRRNRRLRQAFTAARVRLRRCEFSLKTTQGALVAERDARKQAEAAAAMWRQMYEREHTKHQDKDSSSTD